MKIWPQCSEKISISTSKMNIFGYQVLISWPGWPTMIPRNIPPSPSIILSVGRWCSQHRIKSRILIWLKTLFVVAVTTNKRKSYTMCSQSPYLAYYQSTVFFGMVFKMNIRVFIATYIMSSFHWAARSSRYKFPRWSMSQSVDKREHSTFAKSGTFV